jgi:hypothetical protein
MIEEDLYLDGRIVRRLPGQWASTLRGSVLSSCPFQAKALVPVQLRKVPRSGLDYGAVDPKLAKLLQDNGSLPRKVCHCELATQ